MTGPWVVAALLAYAALIGTIVHWPPRHHGQRPRGQCITVNGGVYADLGAARDVSVSLLDAGGVRLGITTSTGEYIAVELTDALLEAAIIGHSLAVLHDAEARAS